MNIAALKINNKILMTYIMYCTLFFLLTFYSTGFSFVDKKVIFDEEALYFTKVQRDKIKQTMLTEFTCEEFRTKINNCEAYRCQSAMLTPDLISLWKIVGKKDNRCEISETRILINQLAAQKVNMQESLPNNGTNISNNNKSNSVIYQSNPWTITCQYDNQEAAQLVNELEVIKNNEWPNPFMINTLGVNCKACKVDARTQQLFCTPIRSGTEL